MLNELEIGLVNQMTEQQMLIAALPYAGYGMLAMIGLNTLAQIVQNKEIEKVNISTVFLHAVLGLVIGECIGLLKVTAG